MDFEALFDGLETEKEREARRELVRELVDAGVSEDEIRAAAAQGRLATLPMELATTRGCTRTLRDVVDELGLSEEFVRRNFLALGLPVPDFDERTVSDDDMEAWGAIRTLFEAGVDEDAVIALSRTAGRSAAQTAEAVAETFTRQFARPGDTERDFGMRMAEVVTTFAPALAPMMATPVRLHLRDRARREAVVQLERAMGTLPDTRDISVCFADLVEFTSLTERVETLELSELTERLETIAAECAQPPVRLVKLIGDAAMFICPEPEALVDVAGSLVERAASDERLPKLRAGMARGQGLNRGGDWYGRPVNLAARIVAVAEPGTLFADAATAEATGHAWEGRGTRELKGISGDVELFCLQPG